MALKNHMEMHGIPKTNISRHDILVDISHKSMDSVHKINNHLFTISGKSIQDMVCSMMNDDQHQTSERKAAENRQTDSNIDKIVFTTCSSGNSLKEDIVKWRLFRDNTSGEEFYKCTKCDGQFKTYKLYATHKCKDRRCPKCYRPFKTNLGLQRHVVIMHPTSHKYTCTICGVSFLTPTSYTLHMKCHGRKLDGRQVYECNVCKTKLYTRKTFLRHKRLHQKFYLCKICKESFDSKEDQMRHSINSHARKRSYKCPYCNVTYLAHITLENHVRRVHKDIAQNLPDNSQSRSVEGTASPEGRVAQYLHAQSRLYNCPHCKLTFVTQIKRDNHVELAHKDKIENMLYYTPQQNAEPICTEETEESNTKYTCSQCQKCFSKEYLLQKHVMKVHWKEDNKINKMKLLNEKQTKLKNNVGLLDTEKDQMNHESDITHTDHLGCCEHYTCDTCGSQFSRKDILERHVKEKHIGVDDSSENEENGPTIINHLDHSQCAEDAPDNAEYFNSVLNTENAPETFKNLDFSLLAKHDTEDIDVEHNLQIHSLESASTPNTKNPLTRNIKNINHAILREYYVATDILKPSGFDAITKRLVYKCKICSTTYSCRGSLYRHIQFRAYDHMFYLRKRETILETGMSPRFTCDVCKNIFTRRWHMLSHRRTHTCKEFKDACVRKDVYTTPDGSKFVLEPDEVQVLNEEQEVTSSTSNDAIKIPTNERNRHVEPLYNNGEADSKSEDEDEPMYTAYPYIPEEDDNIGQIYNASDKQTTSISTGVDTLYFDSASDNINESDTTAIAEESDKITSSESNITTNVNLWAAKEIDKSLGNDSEQHDSISNGNTGQIISKLGPNKPDEVVAGKQNILAYTAEQTRPTRDLNISLDKGLKIINTLELPTRNRNKTGDIVTRTHDSLTHTRHGMNTTKENNTQTNIYTADTTNYIDKGDKRIQTPIEDIPVLGTTITAEGKDTKTIKYSSASTAPITTNANKTITINEFKQCKPTKVKNFTASIDAEKDNALSNVIVDDVRECIKCKNARTGGHKRLQCRLCDRIFCHLCSGLSKDMFEVLYRKDGTCAFGLWWTCYLCEHVVPKFTQLLQQLGDFEQLINERLTDMEQNLAVLKPNGKF